MRTTRVWWVCVLSLLAPPLGAQQEAVVAIQVHGNTLTPADEIVAASGVAVGDVVTVELLERAGERLRSAKRFESVEVLKRYASLSDPTRILILIQVDEGPVRVDLPDVDIPAGGGTRPPVRPVVVRRSKLNVMFIPLLGAQDGYGVSYGAQAAITGHRSTRRRVVVPATWGGDKRIAAEYQQEFSRRLIPRLRSGALTQRRTHPFFDQHADRKRVWGRAEWSVLRDIRAGAEMAWQSSSLAGDRDRARSVGGDVVLDTRVDPVMPHNAVLVRAAVERLSFTSTTAVRTELDASGYIGLPRGSVVALRAVREHFSRPAPAFYKSILGGSANLRGFRAGHAIGDTLVGGSVEVRVPLTSPLRTARFGYSVFYDAATTYDAGQRLRDQKPGQGVGAGIWATAPLFRVSVAVARGLGAGTRAHFGAGLTF